MLYRLVEWSFAQLFGWHDWAWRSRRLPPLGLIAPGSSPILPLVDPSDWGVNTMQGARWETGMDNSPMYAGPVTYYVLAAPRLERGLPCLQACCGTNVMFWCATPLPEPGTTAPTGARTTSAGLSSSVRRTT